MSDQIQEIARLLCIQSNGDGLMSKIRQTIELLQEAAAERDQMRTELGDGTTGNKYRAELYDEVWQKARDMGYGNVTMALDELTRLRAGREPVAYQCREIGEGDWADCDKKWFDYCERSPLHDTRKLYATPQPSAVPDDYLIVPIQPTEEMRKRAQDYLAAEGMIVSDWLVHTVYTEMLAAAPSAPATVQGDADNYRWLREQHNNVNSDIGVYDGANILATPEGDLDLDAALAAPVQGEAVAWARQCDLDESDPAIFVAREEVQESGYLVPLYTTPQPAPAQDVAGLLEWAVDRWHAEVANRPLQNVHRRSLDDTWRQVIRKLGGDAGLLCGPAHDALAAHDKQSGGEE